MAPNWEPRRDSTYVGMVHDLHCVVHRSERSAHPETLRCLLCKNRIVDDDPWTDVRVGEGGLQTLLSRQSSAHGALSSTQSSRYGDVKEKLSLLLIEPVTYGFRGVDRRATAN